MTLRRIILTSGEPAGIGPDCCVTIAQQDWACDLVVAGDVDLLSATAAAIGVPLRLTPYSSGLPRERHQAGTLRVLHTALAAAVTASQLDVRNVPYVLALLDRACNGCLAHEFDAMVTAPVQKSVILSAGRAFSGHTEYLAERSGSALPVMLLVAGNMRVALVTTHLPLSAVPAAITATRLESTLRVVEADVRKRLAIAAPRILVLGLNPHAGESGYLGREEVEVIAPVVDKLRTEGLQVRGPVPADTAFTPHMLDSADVIVCMYHDQGLPVIKHAGFGRAVNVTLGLPYIRTSVDHGTALDLARSGRADASSLAAALGLAMQLN
jgi:4-hydroxythreonine-4-phosphate dehydrogenase